tara:strand:+ start:194 stop:496 length:303 start_codon:yes stop_codon:yes gene_type:complete
MGTREKRIIDTIVLTANCVLLQESIHDVLEGNPVRPFNNDKLQEALKTVLEYTSPYVDHFLRVDKDGSEGGQEEAMKFINVVNKETKECHGKIVKQMSWK